jgi:hypothetical protein
MAITLKDFNQSLTDNNLISKPENFNKDNATFTPLTDNIGNLDSTEGTIEQAKIRFYMIFSTIFLDSSKLESFKNEIISGPLKTIKNKEKIKKTMDNICEDLAKDYKKEYDAEQKVFTTFKQSKTYKDYTDGIELKMYPKGKTRIFDFTTVPIGDTMIVNELIKQLYSTTPISEPKNTFNDKTKLN